MSTAQPENAGAATPGPRILLYSDDVDAARAGAARGRPSAPARRPRHRVGRGGHRGRRHRAGRVGRARPADPRRRGRQGRWPRARPSAQGRDLPVPADPGPHRPPAGRLARVLVERRRRRQPPPRPGRAARGRRGDSSSRRPSPDDGRPHARRPAPTWPDLFATLAARQDLSTDQTSWAMAEIMSGAASTPKIAAFLLGAEDQGRVRRASSRRWPTRCSRTPSASRSPGGPSTSSAPAATARTR